MLMIHAPAGLKASAVKTLCCGPPSGASRERKSCCSALSHSTLSLAFGVALLCEASGVCLSGFRCVCEVNLHHSSERFFPLSVLLSVLYITQYSTVDWIYSMSIIFVSSSIG